MANDTKQPENGTEAAAPVDAIVMRLFVWPEFAPDYTNGLAFAIAETIQQAQEMIAEQKGYFPSDWGPCEEHSLGSPFAKYCNGGG